MTPPGTDAVRLDAVVIGAGLAGLYSLHRLREVGLSVKTLERGGGVGGTWYWNRYPGARCDVESVDYSFGFDPELEQEWVWTERYASQGEILDYVDHVAERHDLLKDVVLETEVTGASYRKDSGRWLVETSTGNYDARYCLFAVGSLSHVQEPPYPGLDTFGGEWYQTSRWPHEGVDLKGKRIGFVGTGSTGIQAIPVIAEDAERLTVFQRTPNFVQPGFNRPLTQEELEAVKGEYRERREINRFSLAGLRETHPDHLYDGAGADLSDEEREEHLEAGWARGGTVGVLFTFNDIMLDPETNRHAVEFMHRKIAEAVDDQELARKLSPTTYPFGGKRVCVDNGYFETYNRANVALVDLNEEPIEEIVPSGVRTAGSRFDLDVIVFAIGFDAITGAITAVDPRGEDGISLREKWRDGPRTYLGVATAGFPNLFFVNGPQSPAPVSNMMVTIEQSVDWITGFMSYLEDRGTPTFDVTTEAEDEGVEEVGELASPSLMMKAPSWYMGANIPGKPRIFVPYLGGVGAYREACDEVAADGYRGFRLSHAALTDGPS